MNDQLLCGLALAAVGVAAIALGVHWLATGAFVAAIPFLAVGSLLALGTHRALAAKDDPAGDELITS
jgi:membrane protein implicated in regulation of membrane protease activity